jgi:predicted permease
MEFHRALTAQALEADGFEPRDAALAATSAFGSTALAQNRARDVWIWPWLQDIAQDIRFAARLLVKDRRFTVAAVVALALGIAANNTVFTFINAALFKDLPFDEPRQIVAVGTRDLRGRDLGVSYLDFQELRRSARAFTAIAASAGFAMNLSDAQRAPERFRGAGVVANAFDLLRVKPALGRSFAPEDDRPGATPVVILGDGVWKSRFGGDAAIIGRTIRVNEVPSTVIGVMPAGFAFPGTAEVWQPLVLLPGVTTAKRDARTLSVVGRLGEGVTIPQARADLETIVTRLKQEYPDTNRTMTATVAPPLESVRRFMRPQLITLMGAVGFVLLIACANVANLLLARATQRSREIAIRASLGATRWRIVRQLLIESFLLATLAGVAGWLLSIYSVRYFGVAFDAMETGAPDRMATPYWINLSMDGTVFAFVAALCLGSSIGFGLAPALHISKTDVNDVLKESGRHAAGSVRARRWTGALMVVELSLTVVLLAGSGLLVRSFLALYATNMVIDYAPLSTGRLALPVARYPTAASRAAFFARLQTRLSSNPSLASATVASDIPFATLGGSLRQLAIEGRTDQAGDSLPTVSYTFVGPRYLETLGLGLMRGHAFRDDGSETDRGSAIVNQRLASMFFPDTDPLGQVIRIVTPGTPLRAAVPLTIVAIVPTLPQFGPKELSAEASVYVPLAADPAPGRLLSIIARGPGLAITAPLIREDLRALDGDLALYSVQAMEDVVSRTRFPARLIGSLFGLLALIALTLSAVGLFALTAQGVVQRTQEIGVRMALGAQASHVVWLFLRRTLAQLAVGLAIGLAGALSMGRLLQTFLVRVEPRDPITLAGITLLLVVVAAAASILPARRAARVDPVIALRYE